MVENRITLRGDDSEAFEQFKEAIKEQRHGAEPSNAEVVRMMMQALDIEEVARDPFRR